MQTVFFQLIVILSLLFQADCQNLVLPSPIKTCQPTTVTWNGTAPSSNFLNLTTALITGEEYTIQFSNIGQEGITFIPTFPPGSKINAHQKAGDSEFTIEDSGHNGCQLQFNALPLSDSPNGDTPEPLTFGQTSDLPPSGQCETTELVWSGGSPPFQFIVASSSQEPSVLLWVNGITTNKFLAIIPFAASTYNLLLFDQGPTPVNTDASLVITPGKGITDCLVLNPFATSSPSSTSVPEGTTTAANSPNETSGPSGEAGDAISSGSSRTRTIVIAVVVIVVGLALVATSVYVIRRIQKLRRGLKMEEFDSRLAVRLEQVKSRNTETKLVA